MSFYHRPPKGEKVILKIGTNDEEEKTEILKLFKEMK
jgi:hypothetical protein